MYSKLDEMYSGNISLVRVAGYSIPQIGERIKLRQMEFYVEEEKHVWQYGRPITIRYSISRGGTYSNGKFSRGEVRHIMEMT